MTSVCESRPPSAGRIACLVVGRDEDALTIDDLGAC
jgi:hypothetical protein